jgi:hypothetical protein
VWERDRRRGGDLACACDALVGASRWRGLSWRAGDEGRRNAPARVRTFYSRRCRGERLAFSRRPAPGDPGFPRRSRRRYREPDLDRIPFVVLLEEAGGSYSDRRGTRNLHLPGGVFSNGKVAAWLTARGGTRSVSYPVCRVRVRSCRSWCCRCSSDPHRGWSWQRRAFRLVLAALTAAIDGLLDAEPLVLAEGDTVLALLGELSRLELVAAQQAVAFEASPEWVDDGAYNGTSWVTAKRGCPRPAARRRLRLGAAMGHQQLLVDIAIEQSYQSFTEAVAYWKQCNAPADAEKHAESQREQREVHLSQSFEGMWFGKVTYDPVAGEIVSTELCRIEQQLFEAEWAETKQQLGREPTVMDLPRTPAQRRADALVEMATRSNTAPPTAADQPRCSPSWSTTRPWPGASANSPRAPSSHPGHWCHGWMRPTSNGSCSTAKAASSTSASSNACSEAANAAASKSATASALTHCARNPSNAARSKHRALRPRRRNKHRQRPAPVPVPQPAPQHPPLARMAPTPTTRPPRKDRPTLHERTGRERTGHQRSRRRRSRGE